jgi:hypothetical protein
MSLRTETQKSLNYLRESRKAILGRGGEISPTAGSKDLPDAIFNIPADTSLAFREDDSIAYRKIVPSKAEEYALVKKIGGMSYKCNNLIPFPYKTLWQNNSQIGVPIEMNGVTFTVNADGSVYALGEASAVIYFHLCQKDFGGSALAGMSTSATANGFTAKDCAYDANNKITMIIIESGAIVDKIYYPMVNYGTTALPYEPFFKGLRDTKVTSLESRGKNLFNANKPNLCRFGFTDEIYELASHSIYIPCEGNTTYTISKVGNITETMLRLGTTDVTPTIGVKILNKNVGGSDINSLTLTTHANAKYLVAMITTSRFSGDINEVLSTIQIECGETATEYKPFEVLDTFAIPTSIVNREDWGRGVSEAYHTDIEYRDGRWYYIKRTKRLVCNGTEGWMLGGTSDYPTLCRVELYYTDVLNVSTSDNAIKSNLYPSRTSGDTYRKNIGISTSSQYIQIYDTEYNTDNIGLWKSHLADLYASGNPLIIEYALAEPIEEDITDLIKGSKFLKTEGGGSIIAHNEYEQNAPSTIKYTVKVGS